PTAGTETTPARLPPAAIRPCRSVVARRCRPRRRCGAAHPRSVHDRWRACSGRPWSCLSVLGAFSENGGGINRRRSRVVLRAPTRAGATAGLHPALFLVVLHRAIVQRGRQAVTDHVFGLEVGEG